jgi:hypothetical protein
LHRSWTRTAGLLLLLMLLAQSAWSLPRNRERSVYLYRGASAFLPPDGLFNVGASFFTSSTLTSFEDLSLKENFTTSAMQMEYGLRPWLRLRAGLPFNYWEVNQVGAAKESGLGDAAFGAVIGLPEFWRHLALAVDLRTTVPIGDEALGLGEGEASRQLGLAASLKIWNYSQLPEARLHLNAGVRVNGADNGTTAVAAGGFEPWIPLYPGIGSDGDATDNDYRYLIAALEFRKNLTTLCVEYADYHLKKKDLLGDSERPRFLTAALRWGDETGWALDAAVDIPLAIEDPNTAYSTLSPDMAYHVGLSYGFAIGGRDSDGDGLRDRLDTCPMAAEDYDGFQDEDGCPDVDNDFDNIPDILDKAPFIPEDIDGFQDFDGVPDPDNDQDGIPDFEDECPDDPEDYDGYQDKEELLDRDGDGIADADDICPDEAEDFDGFQDEDGCPDPDNDLDGIPDAEDACPNDPEDYDGVEDDDGCPE